MKLGELVKLFESDELHEPQEDYTVVVAFGETGNACVEDNVPFFSLDIRGISVYHDTKTVVIETC